MALERIRIQKWRSRYVLEGSGRISELRQEIPKFKEGQFGIGKGINKYLTVIVREPLKDDPGYLLPSDNQAELQIPVAVVSNRYELVQHRDIVTELETTLKQIDREQIHLDLNPERLEAKLIITEYGERMRISFILPDYKFDPGDERGEIVLLQVNALNSVDKTTPLEINLTWRGLNFTIGMPALRGASLKKNHLKSRKSAKSIIKTFLDENLKNASSDIREFRNWVDTPVSPRQIEHWIDEIVAEKWSKEAAARTYHIAKTGYDGKVEPGGEKVPPHKYKIKDTSKVPNSFAPVRNVYDISQVLSWIANQQPTIQQQLGWMQDIPDLMQALLATKQPIYSGIAKID